MKNGHSLCQKCILLDGFLGIHVNSQGYCDYCADPSYQNINWSKVQITPLMKKERLIDWERTIAGMQSTHHEQEYDCVIGYSGGKDSTALVDTFITKYTLNPLLITIDTGFMTDIAKQNIQDTLTKMKLHKNHLFIEGAIPTFTKLYQYYFTHHSSHERTLTVDICHYCTNLIHTILVKEAMNRDIPYVIIGFSPDQIKYYFYETYKENILKDGTPNEDFAHHLEDEDFRWYFNDLDSSKPIPREIYPYHVMDYNELEIIQRIESKGLIAPGKGDPVLTNCHVVKAALMYDFFRYGGITYALQYAELVRQQQDVQLWKVLRKKWLRTMIQVSQAISNGVFDKKGIEMFLNKIGVSELDLKKIICSLKASDPNRQQITHNIELIKNKKLT